MEIKEMIEVLKAFEEKKEVERLISDHGDFWVTLDSEYIYFDFVNQTYRIKPQPNCIPFIFNDRDLFRGRYVRWIGEEKEFMVDIITPKGLLFDSTLFTYEELFNCMEFIDGSKFGKIQ